MAWLRWVTEDPELLWLQAAGTAAELHEQLRFLCFSFLGVGGLRQTQLLQRVVGQ